MLGYMLVCKKKKIRMCQNGGFNEITLRMAITKQFICEIEWAYLSCLIILWSSNLYKKSNAVLGEGCLVAHKITIYFAD